MCQLKTSSCFYVLISLLFIFLLKELQCTLPDPHAILKWQHLQHTKLSGVDTKLQPLLNLDNATIFSHDNSFTSWQDLHVQSEDVPQRGSYRCVRREVSQAS